MAYMLWDVGECGGGQRQGTDYFYQSCATPVPKERLTWEQFRKDLAQRVRVRRAGADAVKREEPPGQGPDCAICTETIKDRCVLKRLCRCENFPCEGHVCNCKDFSVCFGCAAKALWQGTNSVMKQKGRYRAKCVRSPQTLDTPIHSSPQAPRTAAVQGRVLCQGHSPSTL